MADETVKDIDGGFTPPATVVELLDRAVEWARDEERWNKGDWFSIMDEGKITVEKRGYDDETWLDLDYGLLTCDNVTACAMGILLLSSQNGPLIRSYYRDRDSFNLSGLASQDPIIASASLLTADALREHVHKDYQRELRYFENSGNIDTATSTVIDVNDGVGNATIIADAFTAARVRAMELGLDRPGTAVEALAARVD